MDTYPIIKIPEEILEIRNSEPELLVNAPTVPNKPIPIKINSPIKPSTPQKEEGIGCFPTIFWSMLGILIININPENAGFILIGLLFLVGVPIWYFSDGAKYQKKIKDYESKLNSYNKEMEGYEKKLKQINIKNIEASIQYEEKLAVYEIAKKEYDQRIGDSSFVNELRTKKLLEFFRNPTKGSFIKINAPYPKGVTEDFFANELVKKFPDKYIYIEIGVKEKNFIGNVYSPDIMLIDPQTFLLIDIEIDEPYVGSTGMPIHFEGGSDNFRNEFFISKGWIVVRFAEVQIVKQTAECLDLLDKIIKWVFDFDNTSNVITTNHSINKIKWWTKEEAHKMAFSRYRNTYLNIEMAEKIVYEEEVYFDDNKFQIT